MNRMKKKLSIILAALMLLTMLPLSIFATEGYPESQHPYLDNCDESWTYTVPGEAEYLAVTFSEDTRTEENCDLIILYDGQGSEIDSYTGSALSGRTVYVPGKTVRIQLISDISVSDYGFRVTEICKASREEYENAKKACGENLSWELDSQGVLTISGQGAMYNWYSSTSVPWDSHRNEIRKIVIENGVTSIAGGAFYNCSALVSVVIPQSVAAIGSNAFADCNTLKNITIPENVSIIEYGTFSDCESLVSVTLPDGLTAIDSDAFSGCESLADITLPDDLTSIRDSAFYGCCSLAAVDIPAGVTEIGYNAFYNCDSLTSIMIPADVTYIGTGAFSNCGQLKGISISPQNQSYMVKNGILFNNDQTELICYPAGKQNAGYMIPASVTSLSYAAFSGCKALVEITLPNGLTSIEYDTFSGCSALESIVIPDGVKSIGSDAFSSCESLANVTLPNSLTSIGNSAFSGCKSLTDITLPDGLTSIEYNAFSGCSALESIVIPNSVTSIGGFAFYGCESLADITLPNGLTSIEYDTFSGCSALESIVIPDGVTSIGSDAFSSCGSLASVTLPDSLTSIEYRAFSGCEALKQIYIPASVISIDWDAFSEATCIFASKGSYAIQFAMNNDLRYVEAPSFVIARRPSKLIIHQGESLDLTGMKVVYYDEDCNRTEITEYQVSGYQPNKTGLQKVMISYQGMTAELMVAVSTDTETYLNFPDPNLENALRNQNADANEDGFISVKEMEALTYLWIERISDISGLEYAVNADLSFYECSVPMEDRFRLNRYQNIVMTEGEVETPAISRNSIDWDVEVQYSAENPNILKIGKDEYGSNLMTGLQTGKTTVTATVGSVSQTFTVTVTDADRLVGEASDSLPAFREYGSYAGEKVVNGLYDDGSLYYIGNHGETLLAEDVQSYMTVARGSYGYVGNTVYWNNYTVLDNENTLWNWGWNDETQQNEKREIAKNIADYTASVTLLDNGNVINTMSPEEILLQDAVQISHLGQNTEEPEYALKRDGTLWEFHGAWNEELERYHYVAKQVDQNVDHIVDSCYVKQDQTTWSLKHQEKLADFAAERAVQQGWWGTYYLLDKNHVLYETYYQESGRSLRVVSDDFKAFYYSEGDSGYVCGYITKSGTVYDSDGNPVQLPFSISELKKLTRGYALKTDGTLWELREERGPLLVLTHVADYSPSNETSGIAIALRLDGTVWVNGMAMDNTYYSSFEKITDMHGPVAESDITLTPPDETTDLATVRGIAPGNTGGQVIQELIASHAVSPSSTIRLLDASGQVVSEDTALGTGMILEITPAGKMRAVVTQGRYTVVVAGDTTGDGRINSRDIAAVQKNVLETASLEGAYALAADVTGDGRVNSRDVAAIQKHVLEIVPIG